MVITPGKVVIWGKVKKKLLLNLWERETDEKEKEKGEEVKRRRIKAEL